MEATANESNWDDVLQKSPKSPKSPKSDGWFSRKSPKSDGRFSRKSPKSDGWVSRKLQGRKRFPVLNPAAVKLWKPFQAFSLQNPYGQCDKCKEYTHNTEDHDAVIALAKKRTKTAKSPKAIIISPFICLDEGMRHGHVFNEEIFRKAWNIVRAASTWFLMKTLACTASRGPEKRYAKATEPSGCIGTTGTRNGKAGWDAAP